MGVTLIAFETDLYSTYPNDRSLVMGTIGKLKKDHEFLKQYNKALSSSSFISVTFAERISTAVETAYQEKYFSEKEDKKELSIKPIQVEKEVILDTTEMPSPNSAKAELAKTGSQEKPGWIASAVASITSLLS